MFKYSSQRSKLHQQGILFSIYLMQRRISSSIVVGRQYLTSWLRKENIVETHTFSHIFSN
jgi:hypothetical protein